MEGNRRSGGGERMRFAPRLTAINDVAVASERCWRRPPAIFDQVVRHPEAREHRLACIFSWAAFEKHACPQ
jgi:hypothetical protein